MINMLVSTIKINNFGDPKYSVNRPNNVSVRIMYWRNVKNDNYSSPALLVFIKYRHDIFLVQHFNDSAVPVILMYLNFLLQCPFSVFWEWWRVL